MPFYCYKTKDGEVRTERFEMGEAPKSIRFSGGKYGARDIVSEHRRNVDHAAQAEWPIEPDAAGVLPSQVKEAEAESIRSGCPTYYNPETGNPIITSRAHYKSFCHANGLYMRNAGYGDASPLNK